MFSRGTCDQVNQQGVLKACASTACAQISVLWEPNCVWVSVSFLLPETGNVSNQLAWEFLDVQVLLEPCLTCKCLWTQIRQKRTCLSLVSTCKTRNSTRMKPGDFQEVTYPGYPKYVVFRKELILGASLVLQYVCQRRGHRFDPWFGKIPHATGQPVPRDTTSEPVCCNYWSPCSCKVCSERGEPPRGEARLLQLEKVRGGEDPVRWKLNE